MKKRFVLSASGLICLLVCLAIWDSVGKASSAQPNIGANDHVSVRAAGRGNPSINFQDGIESLASYKGSATSQQLFEQNQAQPCAIVSADFDEDGVPDLIAGYAAPAGGTLSMQRGNVDSIYPNSPEAKQRKSDGSFTDSAFLSSARMFDISVSPDFLAAGDFDADGHWDMVAAARGSKTLYLFSGDGHGNFGTAKQIDLPGRATAITSGDINRADGLTDLVVAVTADGGPKALVFEGPEGALKSNPEIFSLPAEAASLAIGRFDEDIFADFVAAAGSELVVAHGRDRKLSLDAAQQATVSQTIVDRRVFAFDIKAITAGNFTGKPETSFALLSSDGTVSLASSRPAPADGKKKKKKKKDKVNEAQAVGKWQGATQLACARVSTGPADGLIVLDEAEREIHILTAGALSPVSLDTAASFETEAKPLALLPMRLNGDALSDLVLLQSGHLAPSILKTAAVTTFTVNKTDDHDDGTCDSGDCTLREAIKAANANLGADTIAFNIPGAGVRRITPTSGLPIVTESVTIDGTTQAGFAGTPIIELHGFGLTTPGLHIAANSSTIKGLLINRFDNSGILVLSSNNIIQGNIIGTDSTGTLSGFEWSNDTGIFIINNDNNLIGGTTAAARNLVSNNDFTGIEITRFASEAAVTDNIIQGNYVGTDITGTQPLPNKVHAVSILGDNTIVGGTVAGARNILSSNGHDGVRFFGPGTLVQGNFIGTDVTGTTVSELGGGVQGEGVSLVGGTTPAARNIISGSAAGAIITRGVMLQGNFIGTDVTGTLALGNGTGVIVNESIVGGAVQGAGNVISGQSSSGVKITGTDCIIQGNLIGPDVTGSAVISNNLGISVSGSHNQIGGTTPAARNVISGNRTGIQIGTAGLPNINSNVVQGNFIGTNAAGSAPLPNTDRGVWISDSVNNTIGGTDNGAGNLIAFNAGEGVLVSLTGGLTSTGNAIRHNSIFSNAGLGIDLNFDGLTPNDSCDGDTGPNNLQNFPVLASATSNGISATIQGTLNSTPNATFTIEFFANAACDGSGFGEGQTFIGSTTVTTGTDCGATFNVTLPASVAVGQFITATATDSTNNTSEFSACAPVVQGPSSFDLCLQDDSSGNLLVINSATGDYQFTNCAGVVLSGTGRIVKKGCTVTLEVNGPDRRVLVRTDTCIKNGTASIQILSQGRTFTITDRNTANNTCACTGGGS